MRTALIVTDMQNGFMNKHTLKLIGRIKDLLEKNLFDLVIFTKFINHQNSPYVNLIGYNGLQKGRETEIVNELKVSAQIVFQKNTYGPFGSDFEAFLKKENIASLYFVGVDTNACVMKGAIDAFEKGYTPFILGYYCGSHSGIKYHQFALKNLQKLIGKRQVIDGKIEERKQIIV